MVVLVGCYAIRLSTPLTLKEAFELRITQLGDCDQPYKRRGRLFKNGAGGSKIDPVHPASITMQKTAQPKRKTPSLAALRRSVASSTAVETGQSIQALEQKLRRPVAQRLAGLKLAS
ncbi:MAG: hypothetical protein QM772_17015 [Ottowia sp.]|uniref:hypothetical protein n=1 Tax=Ottowia sp. TaxID=1898956 RepID=UPI0039E50D37